LGGGLMVNFEENQDHYHLKDIYNDFNKEYGHIDGVYDVLKEFMYLWEENYWEWLFIVHKNWTNPLIDEDIPYTNSVPMSLVLIQAIKNGINPGTQSVDLSVDYDSFRNLNIFFEKLTSLYLGRDLVADDLWALNKSDLTERVLGVLDQFDVFKGSIFLKDDFFHFIKDVSWDMEAKPFFIQFHNLFNSFLFENQENSETNFNQELNKIVILLAHCCAVWSDSPRIRQEHVIKAYKTLFKLITTDITSMVDKTYYTGHLVCETCKEVYTLLENEAPQDFSHCSCGGDLNYLNQSKTCNENNK
jgi:hypothetical protein